MIVATVGILATVAATATSSRGRDLILRLRLRIALGQLLDGLPPDRVPLARFTAIPGPRLRSSTRGAAPAALRSEGLAGFVLALSAESSSPDSVAAGAAALAIRREAVRAIPNLEQALKERPRDVRLLNDLAAAQFEADRPLDALESADAALRIDRQFVHALYNRALILDRLGLAPAAADAWRDCLDAGPDASVATVVRERLRIAEIGSEKDRWRAAEPGLIAAAAAGDEVTVERIVSQFPAFVRTSAETYLTRWAEGVGGDPAKADQWLRVVRTASAALRHRNETLLAEAVQAIDTAIAQGDSGRLALLARGHLAYDRGRKAYQVRDYANAESELRDAAASFSVARSPMEQVARAYTGSVLIEASRSGEAHDILTGIVAAARPQAGHRALMAHSEYLLAICDTFSGRWNAAVEETKHSAALFHELGETANAASSETMLAAVLDLLGQDDTGWEVRRRAFESTSAGGALNRLLATVGTGTRAATRAGDPDRALSLLDVEMSLAARVRDPLLSADLLTRRALIQHERGAFEDRDTSLERARMAVSAVKDKNERARLTIDLQGAEAIIVRDRDPGRAIELLSRALAFSIQTNRLFVRPGLLLQRARAYLAANKAHLALQDFSTAIDELEAQRGAITDLGLRSRMFNTAKELFDGALALHAQRGDAEEAFRVAEHARARSLLDVLDGTPRPVTSSSVVASQLTPGTLLLEYAALPKQLVIFAIRSDGMRMHVVPVNRNKLSSPAGDLAAILLEPVRNELATARHLIIVPDGILQRTAFGALAWNGQFLAQTHVISEAPSASRLVVPDVAPRPKQSSVLIVGNPDPDPERNLDALPSIRREIAATRAIHPVSRVLFGAEATKRRFAFEAPQYDILHFAGHGLSDEDSLTPALLFRDDTGGAARMDTSEIARLKLPRKPLVVLAACGTLRGRIAGVEGMPSLARSFLEAGASAVVGTLTDIDDEQATALLTSFHRQVAAGARPDDALRNAQMEAISRGGAAALPKNWAQFVVYTATP